MSKLKPCPFCDGETEMKIEPHAPKGFDYTPRCENPSCAGRLAKKWHNEKNAIEAWNRRAEPLQIVNNGEMTNGEIYNKFRLNYPDLDVDDYRPISDFLTGNRQGITVFLTNGDIIVYYPLPEPYKESEV